jgi:chromate transporter
MIKRECVDEERWVDEQTFRKTLAVYQVLPGPEATELCIYFGRLRAGKLGGLLAGLGFILPGVALMLGLTILYVEADLAGQVDELFYGLKAAVCALIAAALVRLGRTFLSDGPLIAIGVGSFALTLFAEASFVIVLLAAGLAYEVWANGSRWLGRATAISPLPALGLVLAGAVTVSLTAEIFFEGLKAGLVTFGGAYTVIPFLHDRAVDSQHWLTEGQFIDGLALGGALPAPLIIFSTFVGYLAGGLAGGIAMTVGIFLPAFVIPIFFHRQFVAAAENERIHAFLLGVAAGVIGLIAAVAIDIADESIVDVPTAVLALVAFAALLRWHSRITVVAVVFGCGLIGAGLQLTVV